MVSLTALPLLPICMARNCIHVQEVSSCVDRMKVRWTPRDRCTAEQSMHRKTPYVTLAHVGFIAPQSKHCWKGRKSNVTMDFPLLPFETSFTNLERISGLYLFPLKFQWRVWYNLVFSQLQFLVARVGPTVFCLVLVVEEWRGGGGY